jgi:hypothetical protein
MSFFLFDGLIETCTIRKILNDQCFNKLLYSPALLHSRPKINILKIIGLVVYIYYEYQFHCCSAGCLARNILEARRQIAAAVSVEKFARRWLCRSAYLNLRSSVLVIQSGIRCILAAKILLHLKNVKAATIIQVMLILKSIELI